ncbi:MAG TPA: XRE family transcriptional regulator [Cyanobacteria bacterium UBA8803]|nr:XRE family transcriptional regulator [Cyanobacteria bacterium UBA9273]HBL60372.1 XRE family transcriptional regulator [Cyanobacteria bacterium UBA8803]
MKWKQFTQDSESELKKLRKQAGLSQASLAKLVGVTGKTVSNWERGITPANLSLSQFQDLCIALDVMPEELTNLFGLVEVDD